MRDILVSLIVLGSVPACFRRPLVGMMMFSLLAYMRLQDLAYGFARYQRWSYLIALVTAAGYLAAKDRKPPVMEVRTYLMVALTAVVGIGLIVSEGEDPVDVPQYLEYVKIIGIAVFTTALVRTKDHLRMLTWVIAMSFAFYGAKNGIAGIVTLGGAKILRGPGGMLEDNNDFALAIVMSLPLLVHLSTSERNKVLSKGVILIVPLSIITVILTNSRGGFLSMCVSIMIMVWRSRNRVMGLSIAGCLAVSAVLMVPDDYVERLETIKNYEEDGSAMGRLMAWKVAGRMIQSHPWFGVGFQRFKQNYLTYEPNPTADQAEGHGTSRVAHNSYLQIWAECGTPAFLIYMAMLGLSFLDIWRIRKEALRRYYVSWILSYCTMFEASLASFMCGSMFLNRAHFDLVYHFVAIVLAFGVIARREMALESTRSERSGRGHRGTLVPVEAPRFRRRQRTTGGFRTTPLGA